jgi:hypothetical protein
MPEKTNTSAEEVENKKYPEADTHDVFLNEHQYEDIRETRHLKHWVIKVSVGAFIFIICAIVLSMCYASIMHNDTFQESLLSSFINAIVELIKFMLT